MQVNHELIVEPIGLDVEKLPRPLNFAELFGNDHPVEIEIGIGKGTFITEQAKARPEGAWIQIPRADITRIRERRMPTRAELDAAAAKHPVVFNWQYAARQVQVLNTAATV